METAIGPADGREPLPRDSREAAHGAARVPVRDAVRHRVRRIAGGAAGTAFPQVRLGTSRCFDRTFGTDGPPTPYPSACRQAPFGGGTRGERDGFAPHLGFFTVRRTPGKPKFLAGYASGVSVFIDDVSPVAAARRLREVAHK
ncbi:hypothetical protein [Streptomyces spongiicola]|uniref:hypothetical protein n=1 Tax=Streptomyces spongiicola TaxID=1690221 RepID=UPI0013A5AF01